MALQFPSTVTVFLILDNTILFFIPTANFSELQLFFSPVGGEFFDIEISSCSKDLYQLQMKLKAIQE